MSVTKFNVLIKDTADNALYSKEFSFSLVAFIALGIQLYKLRKSAVSYCSISRILLG